ncbi:MULTISPECIES: ammonium transporter [unclassified Psychrobacillus]|uniref:ammonium transporter n=1 Tax=unclassified Psychrobacillus TaxID=2636677 RepID=UPI00146C68C6|nr:MULTISPECIES: ammonium transporter [unclassified Psychrobacillus]MCM3356993.1 ammonium transporter [Psychrobacillus sp. MER TA 171]NME04775.1 ammonium transporter [Psychrobacillus sp. BL-248-WT-3]
MEDVMYLMNSLWTMVAAILVIFMIGGFILLEAGSTRMKNAGHVAGKTIFTFGLASLVFWAVGYGFIFGGNANFFVGMTDFFYAGGGEDGASVSPTVFFVFQLAFAGIAITIALGGFAERAKLSAYVIFTILFGIIVYPVIAHWVWGGGWLAEHGKQDFAGSTVVHLTGAAAALAATMILKPRIGKFNKDGSSNNLAGHNQVYTALGVLILWVGWFGFNAGSTVSVDAAFFGYVALNTALAAGAGAVAATFISWVALGKSDIPTILNGALAGLVAITASCAFVDVWASVVIGLIAGVLVFYSARFFEKRKIDDPIYALSVHGTAGIWGTLSTGFFATTELATTGKPGLFYGGGVDQLLVQLMGVAACGAFAFAVSYAILFIMKKVMGGIRVTEEEEIMGLDMSEHGNYGYPEQMVLEEAKGTN